MKNLSNSFEQLKIVRYLLYWTALIIPVAFAVGSLVALFLWIQRILKISNSENNHKNIG